MVRLFIFLLIICLLLFLGISYMEANSQVLAITGITETDIQFSFTDQTKVLLAMGIAFFQFAVVIFALLDSIADTFKLIVRPFAVFLPLVAFLGAMYQTFMPMLAPILPDQAVQSMGVDASATMTQVVNNPQFTTGVFITLGALFLFLLTYRALTAESTEVKALRAELIKAKKAARVR